MILIMTSQRLALEWTAAYIHLFGGNGENITLAGLSAGAYSVQMQLYYELRTGQNYIKRAMMFSNAIMAQPKTVAESQAAFDGLLEAFNIDKSLPSRERLRRLRAVPMKDIVDKVMSLYVLALDSAETRKIHTFRAVEDYEFVRPDMYATIASGEFARQFAKRGLALIIGETTQEEVLYSATNPPTSFADLPVQLDNYYPPEQAAKLLKLFPVAPDLAPKELRHAFGEIVATGQVYASTRALVKSLLEHVPPHKVLRYRIADKPEWLRKMSIFP